MMTAAQAERALAEVLSREYRDDDAIVVGFSDAPIPWPLGRRRGRGARGLVVFGGLAVAVRQESVVAVAHWWGVSDQTVTAWRKATGVPRDTDGTVWLRHGYGQEGWFAEARAKPHAKAGDPERRAKIAAAKRGKRRRPEDVKAAHDACRTETPLTLEDARRVVARDVEHSNTVRRHSVIGYLDSRPPHREVPPEE